MSSLVVQVKEGKLKGSLVENVEGGEYIAFRGIPYAEPPVGELRFKDPRPPKPWSGIRNVPNIVRTSLQYDPLLTKAISGCEDSLYLNISTNRNNSPEDGQPVIVFIHGGCFIMGSPDAKLYGPDYLVNRNVIVVTISYRLGCLGFLNLDMPDAAGNQGIKDQHAALKWIKENIHAFGGDPENITLFGHSAGAAAAHLHALSAWSQGLFHKVILMSGSLTNPWATEKKNPVEVGLQLSEMCGKKTTNTAEALSFLKSLPAKKLIEGAMKMNPDYVVENFFTTWAPSIDSASAQPFLPEPAYVMAKRGINIPLLIGYTKDEGISTVVKPYESDFCEINKDFAKHLARELRVEPDQVKNIAEPVRKYYFGQDPIKSSTKIKEYIKLKSDVIVINGIQEVVDYQLKKPTPTYLYRYSYIGSWDTYRTMMKCQVKGACHSDELPGIFHCSAYMGRKSHARGSKDRLLMERLTRMWANFAKTGDPTPFLDSTIITKRWKPVTQKQRNYMEIESTLTPGVNAGESSWKLWKPIFESLHSQ